MKGKDISQYRRRNYKDELFLPIVAHSLNT